MLDRGADINKPDSRGLPPIFIAAANKHLGVVRLLLERGALVNATSQHGSLLCELAVKGNHEALRFLLNRHSGKIADSYNESSKSQPDTHKKDMNQALVLAAKSGSSAAMQVLLDHGAGVDLLLKAPASDLLSALIESAVSGNYEVVNILLMTNVDVSGLDNRGSALSAAISNGHDAVARLLLQHRSGQVLTAIQHLRTQGKRKHIKRLMELVSQMQQSGRRWESCPQSSLVPPNVQCLRKKFLWQHFNMLRASSKSSTKLSELSNILPRHVDTWTAGMKTMRKLCKGERPKNVYDTIAFLCLSRAMLETLGKLHHADYKDDFDLDLHRWQMLFMDEDEGGDLEAYKEAVLLMWGVTLHRIDESDPDGAIIQRFHDLATLLAGNADDIYGNSPLSDPNVVRLEQNEHSQFQNRDDLIQVTRGDEHMRDRKGKNVQLQQPAFPDRAPQAPRRTLAKEIQRHPTIVEPLATFLIAGSIFAIVILFTQGEIYL